MEKRNFPLFVHFPKKTLSSAGKVVEHFTYGRAV